MDESVFAEFKNSNGEVKLMAFAGQLLVTVTPRYGDPLVEYFNKKDHKKAEIAYGYFQHYFTV